MLDRFLSERSEVSLRDEARVGIRRRGVGICDEVLREEKTLETVEIMTR